MTSTLSYDFTLHKIKVLYFTINIFICSLHSFKAKFLIETLKLTEAQVGYAYTLQAVMFIGSIWWSGLADKAAGRHRNLSVLAAMGYAVAACGLLVVKRMGGGFWWVVSVMGVSYWLSSALFPLLDAQVMYLLDAYYERHEKIKNEQNASIELPEVEEKNTQTTSTATTSTSTATTVTATTTEVANNEKRVTVVSGGKKLFSRQRMWGAVGVAMSSWLSLAANRHFQSNAGMFIVLFCSAVAYATCVWFFLPVHATHVSKSRNPAEHPLLQLLRIPLFLSFMLFILSAGVLRVIINIYLSYYTDVKMALGDVAVAYSSAVRLISELSMFFLGHHFTEVFGYHGVLLISQGAGIIRILGYGFITGPRMRDLPKFLHYFMVGCLELLKGINTGLIVVGATKLASEMAPSGCEHTAQGLLTGIYIGLASGIGGLFSGFFLQYVKPGDIGAMFRLTGWIALAIYLVFFTQFYLSGLLSPNRGNLSSNSNKNISK